MKTRFEIHVTHKRKDGKLYLRVYPLDKVKDLMEAEDALTGWLEKRKNKLDPRFWTERATSKIMLVYSVYTDEGDYQMRKLIFTVEPPKLVPLNK